MENEINITSTQKLKNFILEQRNFFADGFDLSDLKRRVKSANKTGADILWSKEAAFDACIELRKAGFIKNDYIRRVMIFTNKNQKSG